jgi:hypothetical protein
VTRSISDPTPVPPYLRHEGCVSAAFTSAMLIPPRRLARWATVSDTETTFAGVVPVVASRHIFFETAAATVVMAYPTSPRDNKTGVSVWDTAEMAKTARVLLRGQAQPELFAQELDVARLLGTGLKVVADSSQVGHYFITAGSETLNRNWSDAAMPYSVATTELLMSTRTRQV